MEKIMAYLDTWDITQMNRQASDGFITKIVWRVTREEDDIRVAVGSSMNFEPKETFIPFDLIKKEDVLEWVKSTIDVSAIEKNLAEQIASKKAPSILTGTPW